MGTPRSRRRLLTALLPVTLLLGACSGGQDAGPVPATAPSSGATVSVSSTAPSATTASRAPSASAGSPAPTTASSSVAAGSASPAPSGASAAGSGRYYLALGDSLAAGVQPGRPTDRTGGYAGRVLAGLRREDPRVEMTNLGCPGEDSATFDRGGRCSYPQGSQLAEATAFLRRHRGDVRLITIDLGANDVNRCVARLQVDDACGQAARERVGTELPRLLRRLRAEAPQTQVVVLDYYNPYAGLWLLGSQGRGLAQASRHGHAELNAAVRAAAAGIGAQVADVSAAFGATDWTPGPDGRPRVVARLCDLTWMCTRADIHTDDTGYAVIAQAVLAARGAAAALSSNP